MSAIERLRALLREEDALLADSLIEPDGASAQLGALAAAGPRAAAAPAEYELLVETVYEGYLLHYARPRLLRCADADLALLVGDRLYALGLERLVALEDLLAVRELADVISLCALVHARGEGELGEAVWVAGSRAIGWGGGEGHERAKSLLRSGDPGAAAALAAVAGQR